MPVRKRVLAADTPEGVNTLRNVLGHTLEIVEAGCFEGALKQSSSGIDLIICGIHFDESRMYDLLRLVKANPVTRAIPFICFRDMDSALSPPVLESLQIACNALGAVAFIDLFQLKTIHGLQNADARFRDIVLRSFVGVEDIHDTER